jgi:hypothetical protein
VAELVLVRRRGLEPASEVLVRWLAEGVRSALDQVSSYSAFSTADFDRYIDENGTPEETPGRVRTLDG